MQRKFLIIIFSLLFQSATCQINWSQTKEWRLYDISPNRIGFTLSIDSLQRYKSILLDSKKINSLLVNAHLWEEETSLWKRIFVATYELSGSKRKVIISNYGGFLLDQVEKKYYLIPLELRDEWYEIFNKAFDELRSP